MVSASRRISGFLGRTLAAAATLLALVAVPVSDAHAQSSSCRSLKAEYAAAQRGGTGSARARQYADAARRQASEIRRAESAARRANCGRSNAGECRQLNATIARMRANLAKLERETARLSGGASRGQLARIRSRMEAACAPSSAPKREVIARRDPGIRQPAVKPARKPLSQETPAVSGRAGMTLLPGGAGFAVAPNGTGNLRTVCVRTCDGYFFPVSFGAGPGQVARDSAVCAALCPSAETVLFTQRIDDEEIANMTSIDGMPYGKLPNAFVYQNAGRNPKCTCGRADPSAIGVAGVTSAQQKPVEGETVATSEPDMPLPIPASRPDLAADPETAANAKAGLTPSGAGEIAGAVSVGEVYDLADGRKNVRVVGGEFLPDPETAIDLRAPVPTPDL